MIPSVFNVDRPGSLATGGVSRWFVAVLAVGLVLRLGILTQTAGLGTKIVDEQHYTLLAHNLVAGNGFAWRAGEPTSIRPPLYPAVVAAVWSVLGTESLQAVRVLQIVFALITAGLVYALGTRLYSRRVGECAAALFWLYPTLLFFNFLLLTETLFTLLLVLFVWLAVELVRAPRAALAVACGLALGAAALTRSILWPLPIVLCPLMALLIRGGLRQRVAAAALLFAGYAVLVAPWAIRNTRLQGVFEVVDTMGGMNLRMGNYEHTPDDRMWDAVALTGEKSWVYGITSDRPDLPMTEGRKEKWAQRKAIEYMRSHPIETARRSLIKFADFWGLEREFVAGVQNGFYAPPMWFTVAASAAILAVYPLTLLAGMLGIWLAPPGGWRPHVLALLPILVITAAHTIVFGHSRYHLPLMPLFGIYAAAFATMLPRVRLADRGVWAGAALTACALLTVWVRQIAIVDLPRLAALLNHAG